jgi:hypothetical protein
MTGSSVADINLYHDLDIATLHKHTWDPASWDLNLNLDTHFETILLPSIQMLPGLPLI